ncbi:MAG: hypothetical protein WBO46_08250 [Caldilineaceae bacterium]
MTLLRPIIDFSQSNLGWDLIKALIGYYGLQDYLSFRYNTRFHSEKVRKIHAYLRNPNLSGEEIFWREIFTGKLLEGDKVQLYNFQISPWFPRKPGLYWTYEAALARRIAFQRHVESIEEGNLVVFDIWGKTLMSELGGVGTVNLRKNRPSVLVTATASGNTERGIPIICSSRVWGEIDRAIRRDGMIEVDLQGTIESMPKEYDSFFFRSPGLPKIAVHVTSILNIKLKVSRLGIVVTPWTLFETSDDKYPYGFTYITHHLNQDDMNKSVEWITDYVDKKNGRLVLIGLLTTAKRLNYR